MAPTSQAVLVNGKVTQAKGTTLFFSGYDDLSQPCLAVNGKVDFVNAGTVTTIHVSTSLYGSAFARAFFESSGSGLSSLLNTASGAIRVYAKADMVAGACAIGTWGDLDVTNDGLIQAVAVGAISTAVGLTTYGGKLTYQGGADSALVVWASGQAIGIEATTVSNAGSIQATGGGLGVLGVPTLGVVSGHVVNSGAITAQVFGDTDSYSVGVWASPLFGTATLINSGTITGGYSVVALSPMTLTNTATGVLNGSVVLTAGASEVHNSGLIDGNVYFGDHDSIYDGVGGSSTGVIYLGHGRNAVNGGALADWVIGGTGSDTVLTGAGDDFVEVIRGDNVLKGGAGFDTLSFAAAAAAAVADFGTGAVSLAGKDLVSGFERAVGSIYGDRLKAGTDAMALLGNDGADTLIGGAGADTLWAGAGGGELTGGGRADLFVFEAGDGAVVVTDFLRGGDADRAIIYGYSAIASVRQVGSSAVVILSDSDSLTFLNTSTSSLSGRLRYTADAGPDLPASVPVWGSTAVSFAYDLTITAGEQLHDSDGIGLYAAVDEGFSLHALHNFGSVYVTNPIDVPGAQGLAAPQGSAAAGAQIVNAEGALISVSCSSGAATGLYLWDSYYTVVNAGTLRVDSTGMAEAIYSTFGPVITNMETGVMEVTSAAFAFGIEIYNGQDLDNRGLIKVQAATTAAGVFETSAEGCHLANSGSITAQATGGTSYGLRLAGTANGVCTIDNSGLIQADVAIWSFDANYHPTDYLTLDISNSGRIVGDIVVDGGKVTLHNSGSVTGAVNLGFGDGVYDGTGGRVSGVIWGNGGDDTLIGGASADRLSGGGEDDWLVTGGGADTVDGGEGADHLRFGGAKAAYVVKVLGSATATVTERSSGDVTVVTGVEFLDFRDGTIATTNGRFGTLSDDAIRGAGANDLLFGLQGADTLTGLDGADTIDGGAGDDVLVGGGGNDLLQGDTGDDTVNGGAGVDTATYASASRGVLASLAALYNEFGDGRDIFVSVENLIGSDYGDILGGDKGDNLVIGGAGDDSLDGGSGGKDTLVGGDGFDTASVVGSYQSYSFHWGADGALILHGRSGDQTLIGIEAVAFDNGYALPIPVNQLPTNTADTLIGSATDDLLNGLAGSDSISGLTGDDTLVGGPGADTLDGGAGTDRVTYDDAATGVRVDLANPAANTGDAAGDLYVSIEQVMGSKYADTLLGSAGDDTLIGGAGVDRIFASSGHDLIYGQRTDTSWHQGGDIVDFSNLGSAISFTNTWTVERVTVESGSGETVLVAIGNIVGTRFDDHMTADTEGFLSGGDGNDVLNASNGAELGGAGDDWLVFRSFGKVDGGDGEDTLSFEVSAAVDYDLGANRYNTYTIKALGIENLMGSAFNDTLTGANGANRIDGGLGDDSLMGGLGADTLVGGLGADTMSGGAGADTYLFGDISQSPIAARDLILSLDYSDVIDLSAIDADTTTAGDQSFVLKAAFDHHAGEAALSYNAGRDRTLLQLDVDGDGVADMAVLIAGSRTDFVGFVL